MDGTIAGVVSRLGHSDRQSPSSTAVATTSPRTIGWALAAGLACVPLLFLALGPWLLTGRVIVEFEPVDRLYYSVAERVSQGQIPYRDFPLEYPIGSLPQLVLPILAGRDVPTYRAAYAAEMLLVNALLVIVLAAHVERREGHGAVPRRLAWYLLCFLFLCRLIVTTLDIVPALLAFLAAAGWFAGRPIRGGLLAALGGLVKVFPALAALPAGLRELSRPRATRLRGSVAFACAFAMGLALWYLLAGPGMAASIRYHKERGLEVESLYAGLLAVAGRLTGGHMGVELGHGSIELQCAWAPAAVAASPYVQLLALGVTLAAFVRPWGRSGIQCTGALILAFFATAPVLSPQYIIWALPFVLAIGGPLGLRARLLYVPICALTFLMYPLLFHRGVLALWIPAMLLLTLRNFLLIVLWGLMAFGTGCTPAPRSANHANLADSS